MGDHVSAQFAFSGNEQIKAAGHDVLVMGRTMRGYLFVMLCIYPAWPLVDGALLVSITKHEQKLGKSFCIYIVRPT